jgi:hypothetical protein
MANARVFFYRIAEAISPRKLPFDVAMESQNCKTWLVSKDIDLPEWLGFYS